MKSIMKSAFAIIAVALMIMVAVVPMVGVFTEDSSATNQYDPKAPATEDKITLTFNLFEGSTAITSPSSYTIQVTWNSGKNSALISYNENKFEKVFDETKMTGAKAVVGSVSDGVFTKDVDFAEYTIGNVAAGTSLTIDIVKGYKQSGDITFNTATTSTTVYSAVSDIIAGQDVVVTYNLYKDAAATKSMTKGEKVATLNAYSQFNVYCPASETDVYVKVTKITVGTKDFAFSNATAVQVVNSTSSSSSIVTADQSVFTINGVDGLPAGQINSLQVLGSDGKSVISNWNTIDATISGASGDKATFMYTLNSGATASKFTFTLWFSSSVSTTGLELTASGNVPLTNALFGTYKMGEVSAADGANLKFNLVTTVDGVNTIQATTTAYVAGGCYYANVPTKTGVTGGTIAPVSTDYEIETSSATAGSSTAVVAKASGTIGTGTSAKTYALAPVSGKVTNVGDGYTFTLNGATKTFGLVGKNVVCKADSNDMKFSFYVDVGAYISFTAASGNSFDAASSGKYYVPTAGISNMQLTLKDKLMTFSFTDGDGKALTGGTLTINVIDANNAVVGHGDITSVLAGSQIALNDASLDTSKLKVYFVWTASEDNGVANTFTASSIATAIAYKETSGVMAVSSLETTYSLYVKDVNGKAIASPTITGAVVSAYVAEDGTKIYEPLSPAVTVTATLDSVGAYEFRVVKDLVNVTLSGTPTNVVIFNVSKAGYYFETVPYLAKVGADKTMTITAKADGFTATIYKNDGVTPIANTQFKLSYTTSGGGATTTVYDVATTDANGKITFLSDEKINDSAVITPTVATGLGTIKNAYGGTSVAYDGVFYGKFLATNNIYTVDITDADGKALAKPAGTLTFSGTGVTTAAATITNYVITVSSAAKAGDVLSVAFTTTSDSTTKAVRTFDDYTLTADDVKNGTISLVSNESTYTVSATDADGKALKLNDNSTKVMKKVNGGTPADITESQSVVYKATANSLKTKITYVITAPADNEVYVANIVGNNTAYGLTTGIYYAFDGKNVAVAESVMSTITFELVDAVGASTLGGLAIGSFVITDSTGAANSTWSWISGTTKWSMIGDKDETYYVKTTPNAGSKYTFADQYIVDGKIKAKEQTVVFTAVDAAGLPIKATFNMYTVASNGAIGDTATTMAFDQNGQNSIIMPLSSTTTYKLVDSTGKYTFTTDGTKFTSAEQTVYFKFAYANGFVYDAINNITAVTVYYKDGTSKSVTAGASVTLDTTNVASYGVTNGKYFSGTDANLKCAESKITGYVPTSVSNATLSYKAVYYSGSAVVKSEALSSEISGNTYTITPNFVSGGYDKVVVQCLANGILYSQATLDAKTGYVADLVPVASDTTSVAVQIVGNDSSYVAVKAADGKAYLSVTDKISKISDDGKYVETYKFAGWYVNGVKTSEELTCTVDNVSSNVVFASFVLDDTQELGKESASGISPTVLVIGIAAVIIALIAVVYAVIQKKE